MKNFQGIIFVLIGTYKENFKSAFVTSNDQDVN